MYYAIGTFVLKKKVKHLVHFLFVLFFLYLQIINDYLF